MKQDVVGGGGGIIGVASAVELARRGAQVTVLERDRVGHGCSYGNAGWLATSRRSKFDRGAAAIIELCRVSVDMWEEISERSPEPLGFERRGLLAVYENAASLESSKPWVDFVGRHGVPAERWTPDQIREREPAVAGPQIGGIFYPNDAHCEPYAAVQTLEAEARTLGVRFVEEAEVYRISRGDGRRRLTTTRGEFSADQVVIATGALRPGAVSRRSLLNSRELHRPVRFPGDAAID